MRVYFKIFITLFIVYAFFTNFYLTTNDAPRFSLTAALVEEHRLEIDSFLNKSIVQPPGYNEDLLRWGLVDYAVYNGHIYSDKAPLGSFLAIPVYYVTRLFTSDTRILAYFVSLFVSGTLTALTAVLIYQIGRYFTGNDNLRLMTAFAYGLGTIAFPYGTIFFSHAITTFLEFGAFYILYTVKKGNLPSTYLYVSGFFAALGVLSDYYAVLIAICLLVYCFSFSKRDTLRFIIPFILILSLLLPYHYIIFNDPFTFPHRFHGTFKERHNQGFYGITKPHPEAFFGLTFSPYKGLFFYNPILIFSLLLFIRFLRKYREEAILIGAISISVFVLNASYLDWGGGVCIGPRHLCPIIPFLFLPLFEVKNTGKEKKGFMVLFLMSLLINFLYIHSRMNLIAVETKFFTLDIPLIHNASNAVNQLLLSYDVVLSLLSSVLIVFLSFIIWSRELSDFLLKAK